ncbi:uncharacterized protein PGTG_13382 [Puccinia graminis f. sp. tritici CRL 75-36-700-3]|uniref:Uncharacterized protein n=1 Tax=Puccinia graminis f. sp. tritici (strain CRL 75-36-700-3 / race SCCL) TaxID=418459 RepID=E3KS88_PUCGT|nr:uncharacterized protein PGTG_13382 [Puccinia graminis f. sp. tritici CRL 75-36-700-3]EFP87163.1 hypothetical protein PGTG_13382 [Puccinia graminis f. sp. tritici CRL 75-36-700-3]
MFNSQVANNSQDRSNPRKRRGTDLALEEYEIKPFSSKTAKLLAQRQDKSAYVFKLGKKEEPFSKIKQESNTFEQKVQKVEDYHPDDFFDVYNWDYVREFPEKETTCAEGDKPKYTLQKLVDDLNKCKPLSQRDHFFWIPRKDATRILRKYNKTGLCLPNRFSKSSKRNSIAKIVLRLSDKRLAIEEYPTLSEGILKPLELSVKAKMDKLQHEKGSYYSEKSASQKIQSIIEYVKKVTKVVPFLIITYLSLFKEHNERIIDPNLVGNLLNFLKEIWKSILESDPTLLGKHSWARINSDLFQLRDLSDQNNTQDNILCKLCNYTSKSGAFVT